MNYNHIFVNEPADTDGDEDQEERIMEAGFIDD